MNKSLCHDMNICFVVVFVVVVKKSELELCCQVVSGCDDYENEWAHVLALS